MTKKYILSVLICFGLFAACTSVHGMEEGERDGNRSFELREVVVDSQQENLEVDGCAVNHDDCVVNVEEVASVQNPVPVQEVQAPPAGGNEDAARLRRQRQAAAAGGGAFLLVDAAVFVFIVGMFILGFSGEGDSDSQ